MSSTTSVQPSNAKRLFIASFLMLVAAGIGFSVRAGILKEWGALYGFTQAELGVITGFGLTGFGLTIIFFSLFADIMGYKSLMVITFALHLLSAVITVLAAPAYGAFGKEGAFWLLTIGTTIFALANGTSEAVINPLTATLYPKEKTHYLNILHAGWPGGLILGAVLGLALIGTVRWEIALATYLIPTFIYGGMLIGQEFPISEARAHGVGLGTMLKEFLAPVLLFLLVLHACVGYVELGTDSWITNITGTILESPQRGLLLFIWTSGLMFALRFFAGPIVHKISPLGLLFGSSLFGVAGLVLLSKAGEGFNLGGAVGAAVVAATIYGIGKTFFWPTMLGVVSEQFPRGGAVTLGAIGGVGMISAGLLGAPGIGFKQDYFASQQLREEAPSTYERYKAAAPNTFLGIRAQGLDQSKVKVLEDKGETLATDLKRAEDSRRPDANLEALNVWWQDAQATAEQDKPPVEAATLFGSRQALLYTAAVPAFMALGYLLLIGYYSARGGYRQVHVEGMGDDAHEVPDPEPVAV